MTRFGFGIIGAGVIATTHAEAITRVPGARLAAVTDTSLESAKRLAELSGCAAEPDIDALLARDDVDIVAVCVPSGLHAEVGVAAAAAGKHLIVEKPIDVTLEAADRLIGAARATGVKLTVISQHRFDPGIVELRRLIDDGALGTLLLGEASTKWYRSQAYYDSGTWRGTWALDGGSLMNQGVHYVDLLLACMGPVAEVTAITATQTHQIEVEDVALALLRFRSGAVGTIVSSTSVYPGLAQRLEISGTQGTVVIEDGEIISRGLAGEPADGQTADRQPDGQPTGASTPDIGIASHVAQIAEFVDAIEHDREPSPTAQDGRAAMEVVLAVYESARERRTVKIPLAAT
ncbi:MAG TPA: Gfo/Idh/MocA family oxidoreductase [Streptosporangiaceae bacterium]|nr:Gfo/Idh/MocA family oxidoreductase [Streptosporangiaceae bacterium]